MIFCVDWNRFATRKFGVWVEAVDEWDEGWLVQRQLRQALDGLRKKDLSCPFLTASRNVDSEVERSSTITWTSRGGTCTRRSTPR